MVEGQPIMRAGIRGCHIAGKEANARQARVLKQLVAVFRCLALSCWAASRMLSGPHPRCRRQAGVQALPSPGATTKCQKRF